MDGSGGTFGHAFAAGLAFGIVDVGQVVGHGDGLERTCLGALSASYASRRAVLARNCAFLLVVAGHKHAAVAASFVADLEDAARAGSRAGLAADTVFLINFREVRLWVDADCVILASAYAVAAAETAERTAVFSGEHGVGKGA